MPLLSQIIARVQADVDPAKRDLREVRGEMVGVGQAAQASSPLVDQMTALLNGQRNELATLRTRLNQAVAGYGAASQQAQQLQQAIDALSASIQAHGSLLAQAAGQAGLLAQGWGAAQRQFSGAAPAALGQTAQGVQALGGAVQGAIAPVDQLAQRIAFQQRQLDLLQNRLTSAVNAHGATSQEAQRLQLAVDKLSASLQSNVQQLDLANQRGAQAAQLQQQQAQSAGGNAQALARLGATAQDADGAVARLAERTALQYQQLELLQRGLVQTAARYGEDSQQADRAKLAIDRLSTSIQQNEQRLQEASRTGINWTQIWIGTQRAVGELAVNAVGRLTQALGGAAQAGLDAYVSNAKLDDSFKSLVAKEQLQSGAAQNMAQALEQATGKAQALAAWNQQLAIQSPFGQEGIARAFQQAQAYGFVSDSANRADITAKRLTQTLVDYAAGNNKNEEAIGNIARALGQVQAKGKLAGDEMNQLTEAGVNVRDILSRAMGVSTEKLVQLQEKGLIPARTAIRAIVEDMERNFGGTAARMSDRIDGLLNSLGDLQQISLRNLFGGAIEALQPVIKELVDTLSADETQAAIKTFGADFGNGLRVALPEVISGVKAAAGAVGELSQTLGPAVDLIANNAVPALGALTFGATAYAGIQFAQAIPATIAATEALLAQIPVLEANAAAFLAASGPMLVVVGVAAAAGYVVVKTAQDISAASAQVYQHSEAWRQSGQALDAYRQASGATQQALSGEAQELERARQAQQEQIKALGQRLVVIGLIDDAIKNQTGIEIGWYDGALKDGTQALNANQQAIKDHAQALQDHIQEQREIEQASTRWVGTLTRLLPTQQDLTQAQHEAAQASEQQRRALEQLALLGERAYAQLATSGSAWRDREASQAAEHAQKLQQISAESGQRLADLDRDTAEKRAEQAQGYQDKIGGLQRDADRERLRDQETFQREQAGRAEEHAQKLGDLAKKTSDLQREADAASAAAAEEYGRQRANLAQRAEEQIAQIARRAAEERAQAEQRYQTQQEDAARSHEQKLADLTQKGLDLRADAARSAADLTQRYTDQIADIQQRAQDQIGDIQQRAQDGQQQRQEDHQGKLADLQQRLAEATTDVQRAAAQKALDEENARYEREEQRAAQKLQQDLARAERERVQAEEKANRERAQVEAKAAQQLQDREAQLAREQAAEEAAYQQRQQQEQQRYQRERAQAEAKAAEDLAQQRVQADKELAQQAEQYAREQAQRAKKLADEQQTLAEATAAENREFAKREAQAQAKYAREQALARTKLDEALADAQAAYGKQEAKLTRHYGQQRQQQLQALAERQAAEQVAYAEQERQQALQHAREEQEQLQALGKSLIAYVEKQKEMGRLDADRAAALEADLRQRYGVRAGIEEAAYAASTAAIDRYAKTAGASVDGVGRSLDSVTQVALVQQQTFDQKLKASVDGVAKRFADGKLGIEQYAQALRDIPSKVTTQIEISLAGQNSAAAQRYVDFKDDQGVDGAPKRALGGPVQAGQLYEVNDNGGRREFFRPATSGTIVPLVPGGAGGGLSMTIGQITIVLPPGTNVNDPRATALAIRDELIRIGRENGGNLFAGQA